MSAAPRAVLLDALGTLVALEPPWPLLVAELARRGVDITEDDARGALLAEIAYYRAHHIEARDAARLSELYGRCTAVLAAALPPHAREIPDLRAALLASLRFTPYPEVAEALVLLRGHGVRLVVVSNWDVSLHHVLATTGLAALVDGAISSAEAGAAKPSPAIFVQALVLAGGVAPADAVHVGDSLEADVAGALGVGIEPVLIDRDGAATAAGVPPGICVVRDLRALSSMTR